MPLHPRAARTRRATARLVALALLAVPGSVIAVTVGTEPAVAAPKFSAYHNVTGKTHQTKFNQLSAKGFRMISLSVYGPPKKARYAAVWVKRSGPKWVAFHGKNLGKTKAFDAKWQSKGYTPQLIAATGSGSTAIFAGTYAKSTDGGKLLLERTADWFRDEVAGLRATSRRVATVAPYGAGSSQRFAFISRKNTRKENWDVTVADRGPAYQGWFNGLTAAGFRPSVVAMGNATSATPNYTAVWTDRRIGSWYNKANLTSTEYQEAFNRAVKKGYYPIQVSGSQLGAKRRFAATFAKTHLPFARTFKVRGEAKANLTGFDTWMKQFIKANNVRAGSLAVARNGKLVYARAFTWAEAGYPITKPTSRFRIASSSKPVTALATMQLQDRGLFGREGLRGKMQPILNVKTPTGGDPVSPHWDMVNLDQLLCQRSGIDNAVHMFNDEEVAEEFGQGLPVTKYQTASWAALRPFDSTPGTTYSYSNFNYSLLGQIIEKKTGKSYEQAVKDSLFAPLGVYRPRIGFSKASNRLSGEVRYETPVTINARNGDSLVAVRSVADSVGTRTTRSYGGWNQKNLDAAGGWVMAPADWAKVLSSFDDGSTPIFTNQALTDTMWDLCVEGETGERGWYRSEQPGPGDTTLVAHEHNGSLPSTASLVIRRSDGLTLVLAFNGRLHDNLYGTREGTQLFKIANKVTTWPTKDLFGSVGIPANN